MIAFRGVLFLIMNAPYCSLYRNNIGSEGAVALARALKVNSSLTWLL
jgi:hypothetical protein